MSSSTNTLFSRRSFLKWSQSAMTLLGAAPLVKGAEAIAEQPASAGVIRPRPSGPS